jgi:two-component system, chemotaxis family, CheB/CheR fusion protein
VHNGALGGVTSLRTRVDNGRMTRVLVVDDNFDTARNFYVTLRSAGHEAEFAVNGYGALEAAHRLRPEVVLLDIGLPDFDGCELARVLRRVPGLERVRILAVSGRGRAEDRHRALQAGCDDYILKPADPAEVERLVSLHR